MIGQCYQLEYNKVNIKAYYSMKWWFCLNKEKGRGLNKKDILFCGHCSRWVSEGIQNNVRCEQKKCNKVQIVCDMWKVGLVKESQHVGYV